VSCQREISGRIRAHPGAPALLLRADPRLNDHHGIKTVVVAGRWISPHERHNRSCVWPGHSGSSAVPR
jgi:hypothetical protein